MVTVAGPATECFLMSSQAALSGIQLWEPAISGVSLGNSLVGATQRGSISPIAGGLPMDWKCSAEEPSAKVMSICQWVASLAASCQIKVGAVISGGKIESSKG